MKKFFLLMLILCSALPLAALRCGEKAVELRGVSYLSGGGFPLTAPAPEKTLRAVTFIHTRARGAAGTVAMLKVLSNLHGNKLSQILVTPDPDSDARTLLPHVRGSRIAFAADSGRRLTMEYMAGSLLFPKTFVIDSKGTIIWCGESVDLGEMVQSYFAGTFDRAAAQKTCPMLMELQTVLRESSHRKMKQLSDKIFALSPAHPGALRMHLFALENSNRIPQAWQLLQERLKAAPRTARLYFTAIDFISRYPYFKNALGPVLIQFDRNIKSEEPRCMMAWELLKRFRYELRPLEYAHILLGKKAPQKTELRHLWLAARAQVAYLAGDLPKAIHYQKQISALPGRKKTDPMLDYFKGAEQLRRRL